MRRLISILFCGLLWAGVAAAQDETPDETEDPTVEDPVSEEGFEVDVDEEEDLDAAEAAEDYLEDVCPGLGMVIRHRDITATLHIFGDVGFAYSYPAHKDRGHT